MSIEERVRNLIAFQVGWDVSVVQMSSTIDSLGMDSLDEIEALMQIEEEFCIEIPDDEAEKLNSVQNAVDYVTDRLALPD